MSHLLPRKLLQRWFAVALFVCALGDLTACSDASAPPFSAIDITGADYAKDLALPDQNGQSRSVHEFQGKIVVLFFGYTQCPDVCPTSMTELAQAKQQLGKDGDRIQVLFVTIDPARDTPDLLKAYLANFDPSFLALRPQGPEQLAALAKDFKVYYKKVDGKTPDSYTMDHTAGMYIYDPQGRLRLFTRYGSGVEGLVSDLRRLLQGA